MAINPLTGINEDETLTVGDRQEIYDAIEDDAWRLRSVVTENGEKYLIGNNNAMIEQKVAVHHANQNGGLMTPKHYEPLVREVAMKAASLYDGNNRKYVEGRAFAQVAFDGFEEVYGTNKETAAVIVKSLISETLDDYYVYNASAAGSNDKDETRNKINDIQDILQMQTTQGMSAYSRIAKLYDKDKAIEKDVARQSVDMYNLFTGRRWRNGKLIQSEALSDKWWAETHPGEEKPENGLEFYEYAKDFADWLQPQVDGAANAYQESWQKAALHESLRRLAAARKKNPEMTWAQEYKIIREVANLNPESEEGERMMWESHLTPEDVRRVRQQHADGYKALMGSDFNKATQGERNRLAAMQQEVAERKAIAEEKKEEAKEERAEQRAEKRKEKEAKEKLEMLKAFSGYKSELDTKKTRQWAVTTRGLNDPDIAAMNREKHEELRKKFHCEPGDRIIARLYRNGKKHDYYVIGVTDDEEDLIIGGKGAVALRGAREKRPPASGRDEIVYGVVRKKDLPRKFQKKEENN